MTTENINHSLNTFPLLSEEMERTLRLRAWKDEIFREALIADPKGVIQRLFPQCFPNGKIPEELTIKVIEEDPDICHVVFPPFPDEFPTPEIPEEQHLELLANMGENPRFDRLREDGGSKPSEKRKPTYMEQAIKRKQAEENKENTPVPGDHHDSRESAKFPTSKELKQAFSELYENKEHLQELRKLIEKDPNKAMQMFFKEYLPNHQFPQGVDFKIIQDTPDTRNIILAPFLDDFRDHGVSKELGSQGRKYPVESGSHIQCCSYTCLIKSTMTN